MKADRASQFMPFAALKGYEEALRQKEKIVVEKSTLSEEALEHLDYQIKRLQEGDIAEVIYYDGENYIKKSGVVSKISFSAKYLTIVTTDISFDDIKEINF